MNIRLKIHSHRPGCEGVIGDTIDVSKTDALFFKSIGGADPADDASSRLWQKADGGIETASVRPMENAATRTERPKAKRQEKT